MFFIIMSVIIFFLGVWLLLLDFFCWIILWTVFSVGIFVCCIYYYIFIYRTMNIMSRRFGRSNISFFVMVSYGWFIKKFFRGWFVFVSLEIFFSGLYFLGFKSFFVSGIVSKWFFWGKGCDWWFYVFSWRYILLGEVVLKSGVGSKFGYRGVVLFFWM